MIKAGAPVKRMLPDVSEEWYDGKEEVCLVRRMQFESRGMTKEFARVAWLRYVSSRDDYYKVQTLKAQNQLLNIR